MNTPFTETNIQGLTEQDSRERPAQGGDHELPPAKKRTFLRILLEVIRDLMFLMVIAADCSIYFWAARKKP